MFIFHFYWTVRVEIDEAGEKCLERERRMTRRRSWSVRKWTGNSLLEGICIQVVPNHSTVVMLWHSICLFRLNAGTGNGIPSVTVSIILLSLACVFFLLCFIFSVQVVKKEALDSVLAVCRHCIYWQYLCFAGMFCSFNSFVTLTEQTC